MAVYDLSPATVAGEVEASRARVIWADGLLYVFTSTEDVTVLKAPEKPTRAKTSHGGNWYTVDGVDVKWRKKGCSCSCGDLCRTSRTVMLQRAVGVA